MGVASHERRVPIWAIAGTSIALFFAIGASPVSAARSASTSVSASYACSATVQGGTKTFASPITFFGTTPSVVAPGASVSMRHFQSKLTLPEGFIALLQAAGATWISWSVSPWYISATDATPKSLTVGKGLSIPKTTLPKPAASMTFTLPASSKTVGPWHAVSKGTMTFTDGRLKFTLNDNLGVAVPANCSPKPAVTMSATTVS